MVIVVAKKVTHSTPTVFVTDKSSTTEDESELASVNKKLKQTNKALIEALRHLEENQV